MFTVELLRPNNQVVKDMKDNNSVEYLVEVRPAGNKSLKDVFIIITNKYYYKVKLPYKTSFSNDYGFIHNYKYSILDICRKYNISTKLYFAKDDSDKNILPYDKSYESEVGKYLPLKEYSRIY